LFGRFNPPILREHDINRQDLVRIDQSIKQGDFAQQKAIVDALQTATEGNGRLHLLGLISDGGVHSHNTHLYALLQAAKEAGVKETYVHFFGDGRDTDPKSGAGYMQELLDKMAQLNYGKVGTVVGRYYAMDRDRRWERILIALQALTEGKGDLGSENPVEDIKAKYGKNETDEFLKPIVYNGEAGRLQGLSCKYFLLDADWETMIRSSFSIIDQIGFVRLCRFCTSILLPSKEKSSFRRPSLWFP
jgi:2,3-bisphosphoglycerate-independent phosphoglycerate mutase